MGLIYNMLIKYHILKFPMGIHMMNGGIIYQCKTYKLLCSEFIALLLLPQINP